MELEMSLALLLLASGLVTVSGTVCSTSFLFPTVINVNSFSTSYIKTPNYPSDYGTSTRTCYYRVEASTFSRVGYRFASDFEMEYDVGCNNNDYVELYDSQYTTSNKIGSYCGSSEPSPSMTTGNYLSIKLRIDGSLGNYKGFKLGVQASSIPSSSDVRSESSSIDLGGAGLGIGAIIGISVGSVVFCLCCCCCILVCCCNNSGKKGEVRPATPPEPQRQVNIILIADDEPRGAPPPGPAMYPPVYPPPPNLAYPPPNPAYPPPPY